MRTKLIADMILRELAVLSASEQASVMALVAASLSQYAKPNVPKKYVPPLDVKREDIERAIEQAGGNLSDASKILGCSRRTLQNKMRLYGMPPGKRGGNRHPPKGGDSIPT